MKHESGITAICKDGTKFWQSFGTGKIYHFDAENNCNLWAESGSVDEALQEYNQE